MPWTYALDLCPCNALSSWRLDLLRLLYEGTQWTTHNREKVPNAAAVDAPGFPDLPAHRDQGNDLKDGHEVGHATENARLADCLRVLAEGVARDKVGDQAQATVVEAAAETVLELSHGCWAMFVVRGS
jgi:hypothetical protein